MLARVRTHTNIENGSVRVGDEDPAQQAHRLLPFSGKNAKDKHTTKPLEADTSTTKPKGR